MKSISSASSEQSSAIAEVTTAVRQMDEMTQHNAETNAAIEQTEAQATNLDRIVEVVSTEEGSGQHAIHTTLQHDESAKPARGVRALQKVVMNAAGAYRSHGSAAVKEDWSEF